METLIIDLLRHVFSFLDAFTLTRAVRVCKIWHEEIDSKREWKWRLDRLELSSAGNDDFQTMKRLILQHVRTIRVFRKFLEHPRSPESVFIDKTMCFGYGFLSFRDYLDPLKKALNLKDNRDIKIKVFGALQYQDPGDRSYEWMDLIHGLMEDLGVNRKDIDIIQQTRGNVELIICRGAKRTKSFASKAFVYRYLIWRVLHERWHQRDISIPDSTDNLADGVATFIKKALTEGLVLRFVLKNPSPARFLENE